MNHHNHQTAWNNILSNSVKRSENNVIQDPLASLVKTLELKSIEFYRIAVIEIRSTCIILGIWIGLLHYFGNINTMLLWLRLLILSSQWRTEMGKFGVHIRNSPNKVIILEPTSGNSVVNARINSNKKYYNPGQDILSSLWYSFNTSWES